MIPADVRLLATKDLSVVQWHAAGSMKVIVVASKVGETSLGSAAGVAQ
jgi:hypothetical protein